MYLCVYLYMYKNVHLCIHSYIHINMKIYADIIIIMSCNQHVNA